MMCTIRIRTAREEDAEAVASLAGQLGYEANADSLRARFTALTDHAGHAVFVAESDTAAVVGWIHLWRRLSLLSEGEVEIMGLVVDRNRRGQGVGRKLVEHGEAWATSTGCHVMRVRCNVMRDDAHRFYERFGYEVGKRQSVFRKAL